MRRYESYPRIAFSFARGCHGSHLGKFFQLTGEKDQRGQKVP
ncbi:hypothetical protein Agau_C102002 [Agrobacterium tumefaciens F2]|nr:hypothetical protein Agau_C102002 [Agrobacterium tumefaciens F2]